jgi:hypothetical protein
MQPVEEGIVDMTVAVEKQHEPAHMIAETISKLPELLERQRASKSIGNL